MRAPTERDRVPVAGIAISHPDRVIYPELGKTKLDVARYYDALADRMLPHVAGRPLTLLRCAGAIAPDAEKGGCVMLRHAKAWGPAAIRRVKIRELHKTGEYLVADSRAALVGLAQMGVVEVHTWNSEADAPYTHDRIVVDLDPGPGVPWKQVIAAAKLARGALLGVGLQSWVKTTGGSGLHVVAPIEAADVKTCLAFAREVAAALVDHDPSRFTTATPKAGRERQILVDVLRNNRTNTSVAAYSLRARPGATVSWPLDWDELGPRLRPDSLTIDSAPARARREVDPWRDYWTTRQRLPTVRVPRASTAIGRTP